MVTLRITRDNFETLMGTYFKVCELLDPDAKITLVDVFVDEDSIDLNVDISKEKDTMN